MGNVVKLSVARRSLEKKAYTERGLLTLEWLYQRKLTAVEKTAFAKLSEGDQISEVMHRFRIADETNLVPWASDEEVEVWNKKYFWKKREE